MSLGRRRFIQNGLAGAVVVGASSPVLSSLAYGAKTTQHVPVVIVGGGLAGLSTARALKQQGIESVVLEARNRVGGRTLNLPLPNGYVVDGGAEWIGPKQDRIAALAKAVGVDTFDAFYDGDGIYEIQGVISKGLLPDLDLADGVQFMKLAWRLQSMADDLPLGEPWLAAQAARLDKISLGDWLKTQQASRWVFETFRIITRAIMAGYPERISLLWFLHYISSGGGLLGIALNDNGLQDLRFKGGSQQVSINVADELGRSVHTNEPVMSIDDQQAGPVVIETHSSRYLADRVVVAMAPADCLRIDFKAGLSGQRNLLNKRWADIARLPLIKHSVIYDQPFWRKAGLNGNVVTDRAAIQLVFDNSPADASMGVLTCFLSAAEVPALASKPDRIKRIPQELTRYFGSQALNVRGYVEKDWSVDPWSSGCITPLTTGVLTSAGESLREPVGRIHWAGTESAIIGCGYMDGAVRSGERVAQEIQGIEGFAGLKG